LQVVRINLCQKVMSVLGGLGILGSISTPCSFCGGSQGDRAHISGPDGDPLVV
jgi:hypothetical protein